MSDKYDECLEELKDQLPEYIEQVGRFQHENTTWEITGHYFTKKPEHCEICGHYPIKEVFVITNKKGKSLHIGNVCINKITNTEIGEWYKKIHDKIERLKKNKKYINILSGMLEDYENDELIIPMSQQGYDRLQAMLNRMCNGLNPTKSQLSLFHYYVKKALKHAKEEQT